MQLKNEQIIMSMLSIIIALSVLMMLGYAQKFVTNSQDDAFPFFMSFNCVVMKSNTKPTASFADIIDANTDIDVLVISRDEGSYFIGIYDPNMVMAFENTYQLLGQSRYFSYADYVNKTKSGILISDSLTHNVEAWKSYTSEAIEDVMYFTDTQSRFNYFGRTTQVLNLASLDTLGEYVYLDYGNKEVAERIIGKLTDLGYSIVPVKYIGLLSTIISPGLTGKGVMMVSGLLIYLFFGIAAYWHYFNRAKEITIHYLHGGTLNTVSQNLGKRFVVLNLCGMIPVFLFSLFLRTKDQLIASNMSIIMFIIFHFLLTVLMFFLALSLVFLIIRDRKRDELYAR
ncbi:MAG: hypothetical protein ACOX21_06740 [Bacillota bacterium]|jgi:hypothetical protein